jgi:hypothetical protein
MRFVVQAHTDDNTLTVTTATAKEAFAKAVEWHVTGRFTHVSITDNIKTYSLDAFHWQWCSWRLRRRSRPRPR